MNLAPATLLAVNASGLIKRYGDVLAVDGLDLEIPAGQFFGLLGPNGSGKTSTIHMLATLIRPSSGSASVFGHDVVRDAVKTRASIGLVFQESALDRTLSIAENLRFAGLLYNLPSRIIEERSAELLELFGLADKRSRPVGSLSGGMRRALDIVRGVIHHPKILFLDEPTIGLDVTAKAIIRDLVRERSEQDGCTVLLASHDTGDMESVCDRVLVIHRGRLLLDRSVAALRSGFLRRKRVTLRTVEADPQVEVAGATIVERGPHRVVLDVDPAAHSIGAVVAAAISTVRLDDISVEDPPFEEIVKAIYASADVGPVANSPGEPTALIGPNA